MRWWSLVSVLAAELLVPSAPALAQRAMRDAPMACFPPGAADPAVTSTRLNLRPPGLLASGLGGQTDYSIAAQAWLPNGQVGLGGNATPVALQFSFVPDGTTWGSGVYGVGPSELIFLLRAQFGADNADLGLELLRSSLASWRTVSGVRFTETTDDGAPWNSNAPGIRGAIRIGGVPYGFGAFLGYAFPPSNGGDVTINTSYFLNNFNIPDNNYRYLRNMFTHEVGHSLGFNHVTPCSATKLMEPTLNLGFDGPAIDDIRGVQRNYGDRFAGNHTYDTAANLGLFSNARPRTVALRSLSTNGKIDYLNPPGEDWFRFTPLDSDVLMKITVTPIGGSYQAGQQSTGCEPRDPPLINAGAAGRLALQLVDIYRNVFADIPAPTIPGAPTVLNLPVGRAPQWIRVYDVGPNRGDDQFVQAYDLTVSGGPFPAYATPPPEPLAIAGVNKVIRGEARCFFLGDINSRAGDGSALPPSAFDWDLDGDGAFEVRGNPRPVSIYHSDGVYTATLRVTDPAGGTSTDSITVTVYGVQGTLDSIDPDTVTRGAATPITLTGTNLRSVTAISQVSVSGSGVLVSGSPTPNAFGTVLTGVRLDVAPSAPLGSRLLTVQTPTGPASIPFTVSDRPPCPGDANGDGVVNFFDLNIILAQYGQSGPVGSLEGDLNRDGIVNFFDLNIVLSAYGVACP